MTTPAMGLALPTPSVTNGIGIAAPGQSWGEQYNSNFTTIDTHTHAPGSGSPVPTSGIAINADLTFAGFNATNLRTTQFSGITLGSLGVSDRNCLLASSGDLYFVDGSGNQVRITSSGGVAGTPGSITGLASPAAVTYTVGSKLFTFTSSTPRVAGIACGPLSIGDATVDNGKQVTISAPAGLAANYAMTLPTALPGANALLALSTTGAISAFGTIVGADVALAGNLSVAGNTGGNSVIRTTGAGLGLSLQGNLAAAGGGADLVFTSTAIRTAGFLGTFQNSGTNKLFVDFQGLLSLAAQAGPLQPTSYVTAITPGGGWGATASGLAYWKDATGNVHVKGTAVWHTGATAMTTLPAGFRPLAVNRSFPAYNSIRAALDVVQVDTAGNVNFVAGSVVDGDVIFFDAVNFLAEA